VFPEHDSSLVKARALWPRPLSGTAYRVTFGISAAPPTQEETENIPVLCCLSLALYCTCALGLAVYGAPYK